MSELDTNYLNDCLDRWGQGDLQGRDGLVRRSIARLEPLARKMLKGFPNVRCWEETADVLQSAISRTLIEQTPTKIFFPNADANAADYRQGFGLTEREFRLIKEQLEPASRMFLIKQGHASVVCQLDLKGFDVELAVISGRASTVDLLQGLVAEVGHDPKIWLPRFAALVKGVNP